MYVPVLLGGFSFGLFFFRGNLFLKVKCVVLLLEQPDGQRKCARHEIPQTNVKFCFFNQEWLFCGKKQLGGTTVICFKLIISIINYCKLNLPMYFCITKQSLGLESTLRYISSIQWDILIPVPQHRSLGFKIQIFLIPLSSYCGSSSASFFSVSNPNKQHFWKMEREPGEKKEAEATIKNIWKNLRRAIFSVSFLVCT